MNLPIAALATDLDGTLIPNLDEPSEVEALQELSSLIQESGLKLLFVTGRSFSLTQNAIEAFQLPSPDAILCDVGSCLMERTSDRDFRISSVYEAAMTEKLRDWSHTKICESVETAGLPLELQDSSRQTHAKCSFYFDGQRIQEVEDRTRRWILDHDVPVQMVISVDPIDSRGLLDLLPVGVNKAFALHWWQLRSGLDLRQIVFAGDSGNDTAAMTSGVRSIVVANAADSLIKAATDFHGQSEDLVITERRATCGVLDGLRHFIAR
ncbi:Mannosylfructose-phosphate phosphatase [Rubripirellula amarantea]|uniref:Mannosylfructose-phosphate phosphatase n=1 Tax=Rubripirellula amarantea TaxID=2527999 RepID=A0A5C5WUK0_9BACT|nr:HAD-IIB family hydrolase [Rubripirellula amarantea]TWT53695.1 Mannosylfructose-phosphate phosphatase [Rubripirellula amarantea]